MVKHISDIGGLRWLRPSAPVIAAFLFTLFLCLPLSSLAASYDFMEQAPVSSEWDVYGLDCFERERCVHVEDAQHVPDQGVQLVNLEPQRLGYLIFKDQLDLERGLEIELNYSLRSDPDWIWKGQGQDGDGLSFFFRDARQGSPVLADSPSAGFSLGYIDAVRAGVFGVGLDYVNKIEQPASPNYWLAGSSTDQFSPTGYAKLRSKTSNELNWSYGVDLEDEFFEKTVRLRLTSDYLLTLSSLEGEDWMDAETNLDLNALGLSDGDGPIRLQNEGLQFGVGASTGDWTMQLFVRSIKISVLEARYRAGDGGRLRLDGAYSSEVRLWPDDQRAVCAVPDEYLIFAGWSDGEASMCRSDSARVDVTAIFIDDPASPEYLLQYNASTCGSLENNDVNRQSSIQYRLRKGRYTPWTQARPDTGCAFFGWSDGEQDINRRDRAEADVEWLARFGYVMEYHVSGRGELSGTARQEVEKDGAASAVSVTADEGFEFAGWSDGLQSTYRQDSLVQSSQVLTAHFREIEGYFVVRDSRTDMKLAEDVPLTYGERYLVRVPSLLPDATVTVTRINGSAQTVLPPDQVASILTKVNDEEYEFGVDRAGQYVVTFQDCAKGVCRTTSVVFVVDTELYIPMVHQRAVPGSTVRVPVRMVDEAASYPVLVPYQVLAYADPARAEGATVADGVLHIESVSSGLEQGIELPLAGDAAGYRVLTLGSDGQHYRLGSLKEHRILVSASRELPLAGSMKGYDALGHPARREGAEYLLAPGEAMTVVLEEVGRTSILPPSLPWGVGEPDNATGIEHCAEMVWHGVYRLGSVNDRACDLERAFACVDDLGQWAFTVETGPWQQGELACRAMNTRYNFALPETDAQLQALRDAHDALGPVAPEKAWLNYSDQEREGRWLNQTGRYQFDWSGSDFQLGLSGETGPVVSLEWDQLVPGAYHLQVVITDALSGRTLTLRQPLRVLEQAQDVSAAPSQYAFPVCPSEDPPRSDIAGCVTGMQPAVTLPWFMLGAGDMAASQGWLNGGRFGLALAEVQDVETGMEAQTVADVNLYGFYVDALVMGLDQAGQAAPVVLPVPGLHIMAGSDWAWFAGGDWQVFRQDYANTLASAPVDWQGACPMPWSATWRTPTEGDACIRLMVNDGGANDADGEVNGSVRVVGGAALVEGAPPVPPVADVITDAENGRSRSSGGAITLGMLALIAAAVFRRQRLPAVS